LIAIEIAAKMLKKKPSSLTVDGFVKSPNSIKFGFPAKAGIRFFQKVTNSLDSGACRGPDPGFTSDAFYEIING
jgi:hypothetical protein